MAEGLARYDTPRERLLGVFDVLGESFQSPASTGARSSTPAPRPTRTARSRGPGEYRAWVAELFVELAREAGAAEPELLARQLVLLYDGAGIAARMDKDMNAAAAAKTVAATLVAAATA